MTRSYVHLNRSSLSEQLNQIKISQRWHRYHSRLLASGAAHLFANTDLDANLISISDLTNAPNFAELQFNAHVVDIYRNSRTAGDQLAFYPKEATDKLWATSLSAVSILARAATAIKSESAYDFVMLCHAICGSPCLSTFYRAIRSMELVDTLPSS
jgi:hypothetical protein